MPSNHHDIAGSTQLGGADAGLFTFSEATLSGNQGIWVESLIGYCAGTAPTWSVLLEDPNDQAKSIILVTGSGNSADLFPNGRFIPIYKWADNEQPWRLKVVTTGKDDAGWVQCDWKVR